MKGLAGAVVLVGLVACESPVGPGTGQPAFLEHTTARFTFRHTATDAAAIAALGTSVEARAGAVLDRLSASGLGTVRVTLYPTHAAMADAVQPVIGSIPAFAIGLVTSARDIHVVSALSTGPYAVARSTTTVIHEFAHCVTLHLRPAAANNPRWLWESVALYLADEPSATDAIQAFLARGTPTFAILNNMSDSAVYGVGHSLATFIVERGGLAALRALVHNGGDTSATLGLTEAQFLSAWVARVSVADTDRVVDHR